MSNKRYLLALNRIVGVGPKTVEIVLKRYPSLADFFALSLKEIEQLGLKPHIAEAIKKFDFSSINTDLAWEKKANHHLLTWDSEDYPALLKEIHDPPFVLYAQGELSALNQTCLAIVGTRNPSPTGSENAYRFARELGQQLTLVSGLALGIDGQVHQGCLDAHGSTIAVLGTGIDVIYPTRHRPLAEKIQYNGLILSEFPLGSRPHAGHFPRRNRIISGLSMATLVVEAAIKSGSLITARFALEQNRNVLAIPGSIHNPQARGCHKLLQEGAKLVTCSLDILEELGCEYRFNPVRENAQSLACNNKNLVKCIGFEVTTVDQISQRSGFKINEVICGLAELELQGIIKAIPGGYMRCY